MLVLILSGLSGILFVFGKQRANDVSHPTGTIPQAVDGCIRGLRYALNQNGTPICSITADRFNIEKRKIGFLRIGLLREARLQNATLTIFNRDDRFDIHLKSLLNRVFPRSVPSGQLSTVHMSPVRLRFHRQDRPAVALSADNGSLRIGKNDMIFTGNVQLETADKILNTEKLRLDLKHATIQTDRVFRISAPVFGWEAKGLTTDLFLKTLKPTIHPRHTGYMAASEGRKDEP